MKLQQISRHAGEWLRGNGPSGDVVISSRVRLGRNLAGFPFTNRCTAHQRREIRQRCQDVLLTERFGDDLLWVDLAETTQIERQMLVERQLISRKLAEGTDELGGAVAVDSAETFAVMINEEDHLRLHALRSGLQLESAFEQVNHLDDLLEERLDYAYSQRFGYLTACPTNVGTGIRVSVLLHLPALRMTGEIEKVRRAARDMHLAVRGLFGEGSEALGDLYQISNQTTLGKSEAEILSEFEAMVAPQIIAYEQQARQALLRQRPQQVADKVWRAWAILTHARLMKTEEVLALLSHLRLGVYLSQIDRVDLPAINELMLLAQSGHLQKLENREMDPAARREARANLIRQRLVR